MKADNARITATAVTAGKTVTAVQGFAVTYSVFAVKRCLSAALPFENHENANQRSLHRKAAVACGINAFVVFP